MLLTGSDGSVVDEDLNEFRIVLSPLAHEIARCVAPEQQHFDAAEHLVGAVFVATQVYMAAIADCHRLSKKDVLGLGPKHANGRTLVSLLNDGGNYWKHKTEWDPEETGTNRAKIGDRTMEAFDCVQESTDWPLAGLLNQIVGSRGEGSILELIGVLEEWREAVSEKHPTRNLPKAWSVSTLT